MSASAMPLQKRALSQTPSIECNRSVSICNYPLTAGIPEERAQHRGKFSAQMFDDGRDKTCSEAFPKASAPSPTHFKASSEDLAKSAAQGDVGSIWMRDKAGAKSTWMPLIFYHPGSFKEDMEIVAEHLDEDLRLQDESSDDPPLP